MAKIWSHPDKDGKHTLKCPQCETVFLSVITKDDETDEIRDITCPNCSHKDEPKIFVATQHKEEAIEALKPEALEELKKHFKKLR